MALTKQELETALRNAHNAGDTYAATQFANALVNGQYGDPHDQGFFHDATDAVKRVGAGAANTFLGAISGDIDTANAITNRIGLQDLLPDDENDAVAYLNGLRQGTREWTDGDQTHWDTMFEGLGSALGFGAAMFASPGKKLRAGFRGAGGLMGMLTKSGRAKLAEQGIKLGELAKMGVKGWAIPGVLVGGGTGASEAMDYVRQYEQETGQELPQWKRDLATIGGNMIGWTEFASFEKLLKGARMKDIKGIFPSLKRMLATGAVEGSQELIARYMQDLMAKGLYNPDMPVGQSAWQEFIVGGEVGIIADLLFNTIAGRRYRAMLNQSKENEQKFRDAEDRRRANVQPEQAAQVRVQYNNGRQGVVTEAQAKELHDTGKATVVGLPYLPPEVADPNDPVQVAEAKAQQVETMLGDKFPLGGWQARQTANGWQVFNGTVGTSSLEKYLPEVQDKQEADALVGVLNHRGGERMVTNNATMSVDQAREKYTPSIRQKLISFGRRLFHPRVNLYTAAQINSAAGTTLQDGYLQEAATYEQAKQAGIPDSEMTAAQRIDAKRIKAGKPLSNGYTIEEARDVLGNKFGLLSQFRLVPTFRDDVYKSRKKKDGTWIVESNKGEQVATRRRTDPTNTQRKPFESGEEAENYAAYLNMKVANGTLMESDLRGIDEVTVDDIRRLLKEKNVSNDINSAAIRKIAQLATGHKAGGKTPIAKMTAGEKALILNKLRGLPTFEEPTTLPEYSFRSYTPEQYKAMKDAAVERGEPMSRDEFEATQGRLSDQAYNALLRDLKKDSSIPALRDKFQTEQQRAAESQRNDREFQQTPEQADMEQRLTEQFKTMGAGKWFKTKVLDVVRSISRGKDGKLKVGERLLKASPQAERLAEGRYSTALQTIFLHLEALKSNPRYVELANKEGTTQEQLDNLLFDLAVDTKLHEMLHWMRDADLFTENEWNMLRKAAAAQKVSGDMDNRIRLIKESPNMSGAEKRAEIAKVRKKGDRTYLERSKTGSYRNQDPVTQMEEAIAELVKDGIRGRVRLGGPHRTIIQKIMDFLKGMIGMKREGINSFDELMDAIRTGEIANRPQGVVRTLKQTERNIGQLINAPESIRTAAPSAPETQETGPQETASANRPQADYLMQQREGAADPFYSALTMTVDKAEGMPKKGDAEQFSKWLDGQQRKGNIRKEERDWIGVDEWLKEKGQVTRQELQDFIRQNQIEIIEVVQRGNRRPVYQQGTGGFYGDYNRARSEVFRQAKDNMRLLRLLGLVKDNNTWRTYISDLNNNQEKQDAIIAAIESKVYPNLGEGTRSVFVDVTGNRDALLRAHVQDAAHPEKVKFRDVFSANSIRALAQNKLPEDLMDEYVTITLSRFRPAQQAQPEEPTYEPVRYNDPNWRLPGGENYTELLVRLPKRFTPDDTFEADHFSGANAENLLAWMRFTERTDADGVPMLFIEEIQSEWHQVGAEEGYASKATDQEKLQEQQELEAGIPVAKANYRNIQQEAGIPSPWSEDFIAKRENAEAESRSAFFHIFGANRLINDQDRLRNPENILRTLKFAMEIHAPLVERQERNNDFGRPMPERRTAFERALHTAPSEATRFMMQFAKSGYIDPETGAGTGYVFLRNIPDNLDIGPIPERFKTTPPRADAIRQYVKAVEIRKTISSADWLRIKQAYKDIHNIYTQIANLNEEERVPDAPWKKSFNMLLMKRAIRWAADNNFRRVGWTTGWTQTFRWHQANFIKDIHVLPSTNNSGDRVVIFRMLPGTNEMGGQSRDIRVLVEDATQIVESSQEHLDGKPLREVVGSKELADKIMSVKEERLIEGKDMPIGGKFFRGLYSNKTVWDVNDFIKKFDSKVFDGMIPVRKKKRDVNFNEAVDQFVNQELAGPMVPVPLDLAENAADIVPGGVLQGQVRQFLTEEEYIDLEDAEDDAREAGVPFPRAAIENQMRQLPYDAAQQLFERYYNDLQQRLNEAPTVQAEIESEKGLVNLVYDREKGELSLPEGVEPDSIQRSQQADVMERFNEYLLQNPDATSDEKLAFVTRLRTVPDATHQWVRVHAFDVTDKMHESAMNGFSYFSKREGEPSKDYFDRIAWHGAPRYHDLYQSETHYDDSSVVNGWGLQIAEDKDVAQIAVNRMRSMPWIDQFMEDAGDEHDFAKNVFASVLRKQIYDGDGITRSIDKALEETKHDLNFRWYTIKQENAGTLPDIFDSAVGAALNKFSKYAKEARERAKKAEYVSGVRTSHIFELDVPEDVVSNMLDWHGLIKDQPFIYEKLKKYVESQPDMRGFAEVMHTTNGNGVYRAFVNRAMSHNTEGIKEASATLRDIGITGVKYIGRKQKYRMILFNPADAKVITRDGEPYTIVNQLKERLPRTMREAKRKYQTSDDLVLKQMEKAYDMGYDVNAWYYTGYKRIITQFRGWRGADVYVTPNTDFASQFSGVNHHGERINDVPFSGEPHRGAVIYPLYIKRNMKLFDPESINEVLEIEKVLQKYLYDGIRFAPVKQSKTWPDSLKKALVEGSQDFKYWTRLQTVRDKYGQYDEMRRRMRDEPAFSKTVIDHYLSLHPETVERAARQADDSVFQLKSRQAVWTHIEPLIPFLKDQDYHGYYDYETRNMRSGIAIFDAKNVHGVFARYSGEDPALDFMNSARESYTQQDVDSVVEQNTKEAEASRAAYLLPRYSTAASPEAQYIARHPGAAPPNMSYSIREPEYSPAGAAAIDAAVGRLPESRHPMEAYNNALDATSTPSKVEYFLTKMKQAAINRYARLERLNWDTDLRENLADSSSIAALLHAERAMGLAGAAIKFGVPVYHKGWAFVANQEMSKDLERRGFPLDLNIDLSSIKGLIQINAPLHQGQNPHGDLRRLAKAYAVARRSEYLDAERGVMVPVDKVQQRRIMEEVAQMVDENGENIIERWWNEYQAYNDHVIKFLKDTGVLTDETAKLWRDASTYFPFYRVAEGATGQMYREAERVFGGMTGAIHLKRLKGGQEPVNMDLEEAMALNLTAAIQMGMKNVAQQRVVRDLIHLGLAEQVTPGSAGPIIEFRVNGKQRRARIYDPLAYESMLSLSGTETVSWIRDTFGKPATWLRELVTRDPGFMLVNLLRDSMSSFVTSGARLTPIVSTFKGLFDGVDTLEMLGVVGGYDYSNDPHDFKRFWRDEMIKAGFEKGSALNIVHRVWNWLGAGTTASDAATRNAVFDDVYRKTNGNFAEASFQAMEVINFGRRGAHPFIRMLGAVVPFLNARFQGMDVFWRAFNGRYTANKARNRQQVIASAIVRGGILLGSTVAYYMAFGDDDQYKEQDDYVKDNYWIIPTPWGVPITIPIPFEVGLLFKTLPEQVIAYEMSGKQGKDGPYDVRTGKELAESAIRSTSTTLEVNPFQVQFLGPLMESMLNHNAFTGRQVVPQYMLDNIEPGAQKEAYTNEMAKVLGKWTNVSPMRIQHTVEGYVGTIGVYLLDAMDAFMKSERIQGDNQSVMPKMNWWDYPVIRRFTGSENGRALVQDAYDLNREITKVYNTLNKLRKDGRIDEAQAYLRNRRVLLSMRGKGNKVKQLLDAFRKAKNQIMNADMPAERKRELINNLDERLNRILAKVIPVLKTQIDLPAFTPYLYPEENNGAE